MRPQPSRLAHPGRPATVPLPIDEVLPTIAAALGRQGAVVVVASPGTGKTTRLPPALLSTDIAGGCCLVQEPRRIAARAAASRVADERGWTVGQEVGYETRFDRRSSAQTRLLYLTEGILAARLQADPSLQGVGAVVLDEFHERSLAADLNLAMLREIRASIRPELRLAVLSATLDPGPVASYLDAEIIEVPARVHPVEILYLERPDPSPLPRQVAVGIRRLWAERPGDSGSILAFLPGAADIRRTAEELGNWAEENGVRVVPLHGDLPADAQDAALRSGQGVDDRVILSTNVAETSVTVEGLSAVVDSGLAKILRHDPQTGLDRLQVLPVSRASADQRAGRAGRLGPGKALRLWTRHDELSRPDRTPPEVLRADLCEAVLGILAWGSSPESFPWFERPAQDRLDAAQETLLGLGAVDGAGRLTAEGERYRRFPLHPRLARLVLEAAKLGRPREGAALAALLSERDICLSGRAFGRSAEPRESSSSDVLDRLALLEEAEAAGFSTDRLRSIGVDAPAARAAVRARDQIERLARTFGPVSRSASPAEEELLRVLLAGYPDRVAKRREPGSDRFLLVGGAGGRLSADSSVHRGAFVVAARLESGRKGERAEGLIRWASRVEPEWLADLHPLQTRMDTWFDRERERVVAVEKVCYWDLPIRERQVPPPAGQAAEILAFEAARDPHAALQPDREAQRLVARCRFLSRVMPDSRVPAWGDEDWRAVLAALAVGRTSFDELRRADLLSAIRARIGRAGLGLLDKHAPDRLEVPSGSRITVEYPEAGAPWLAAKIQELFGWSHGPRVAGGAVPVLLHLLAPSGRPLQVTEDLESFWGRTYAEVRKEMRGRYPRHHWPEDPWTAPPSRKSTFKPGAAAGRRR